MALKPKNVYRRCVLHAARSHGEYSVLDLIYEPEAVLKGPSTNARKASGE